MTAPGWSAAIGYEVILDFPAEADALAFRGWAVERHLRDALATGCFGEIELARIHSTRYRVRYLTTDAGRLERYLREHGPRHQDELAQACPAATVASREIWERLDSFAFDPEL